MNNFAKGAIAGGVVAVVAWFAISRTIDAKLAEGGHAMLASAEGDLRTAIDRQLTREIPSRVQAEMSRTLNGYGLTPASGRQIASLLSRAESIGLLGLR